MGIFPPDTAGMTDAERLVLAVQSTVEVAAMVAQARASDPTLFPLMPNDFVGHLTRKLLGDLVEFGIEPEGWQAAFAGPQTNGWGVV